MASSPGPASAPLPRGGRALRGIRARLGLLALAVAVPLVVLFTVRALERRRAEERQLRERALELVSVAAASLEVEIRGTASFLAAVAPALGDAAPGAATDSVLARFYRDARSPYTNLYVLDTTGAVIASARTVPPGTTIPQRGPRSVFRHALGHGDFHAGDVVRSRVRPDSAWVLSFYLPLRSAATGRVHAVLSTAMPLDSMAALRLATELPAGSVITALDSTGRVVLRTLDPANWIGRDFGAHPGVAQDLVLRSGVAAAQSADGTLRYTGFKTMTAPPWIVYVGLPQRETTDVVKRQFMTDLAMGAAIVLLVLLASWQVAIRIVVPIESLTADARAITAGDEQRRSRIAGDDEIGELAVAFNRMADTAAERRDALLASQDQLRQSQKMEALGSFAGGIAHDFNNYLASIRGYAELAAEALPEGSDGRRDLDEVLRAAERASALTRQILVFSRRQVVQQAVVDPGVVVRDVERLLAPLMGAQIAVQVVLGHGGARVQADRGQLEQVLVNLGANARDAMPGGGTFTLGTRTARVTAGAEPAPAIGAGEWVVLTATDTGSGIPASVQAHLFEPFFTTKARGRGTGLGLALVWSIVRQAGGTVLVESAEGRGSTFSIWLPRVADDLPVEPTTPEATAIPDAAVPPAGTVLVVEDDDAVRRMTVQVLRRAGYRVHEVPDAESALARLEGEARDCDLVVSDVVMRGMGGAALVHEVQARRPGLPVLLTSGYADDERIAATVALPGVAFLAKPFSGEAMLRMVRGLLAGTRVES